MNGNTSEVTWHNAKVDAPVESNFYLCIHPSSGRAHVFEFNTDDRQWYREDGGRVVEVAYWAQLPTPDTLFVDSRDTTGQTELATTVALWRLVETMESTSPPNDPERAHSVMDGALINAIRLLAGELPPAQQEAVRRILSAWDGAAKWFA